MTEQAKKDAISALYQSRKNRETHPEGKTDSGGRWYPSAAEDQDGDGMCVRSPSRAWPWSYMLRCRTRRHCACLIAARLAGLDVPADARVVIA